MNKCFVIYCEKDLDHYGFLTNGDWKSGGGLIFNYEFSHSIYKAKKFTEERLIECITDCLTDEGYNWHVFEW